MFEAIFDCPNGVGAMLLAAGGWRPGMLLHTLHCKDSPRHKEGPTPNANSAVTPSHPHSHLLGGHLPSCSLSWRGRPVPPSPQSLACSPGCSAPSSALEREPGAPSPCLPGDSRGASSPRNCLLPSPVPLLLPTSRALFSAPSWLLLSQAEQRAPQAQLSPCPSLCLLQRLFPLPKNENPTST